MTPIPFSSSAPSLVSSSSSSSAPMSAAPALLQSSRNMEDTYFHMITFLNPEDVQSLSLTSKDLCCLNAKTWQKKASHIRHLLHQISDTALRENLHMKFEDFMSQLPLGADVKKSIAANEKFNNFIHEIIKLCHSYDKQSYDYKYFKNFIADGMIVHLLLLKVHPNPSPNLTKFCQANYHQYWKDAVLSKDMHVMRLLVALRVPASVIIGQEDRNTLLHLAAKMGDPEVVDFLLEHANVDPNLKNARGQTAWEIARDNGREACMKLLTP